MPEVRQLRARLFALDLRRRRDLAHSATTSIGGVKTRELIRRLSPATHNQLLQYLKVCQTSRIGPAFERPSTGNPVDAKCPQPPAHESSCRLGTEIEKQLQRFDSGYRFA